MTDKRILWVCGMLTAFAITVFTLMIFAMKADKKDIQIISNKLLQAQSLNERCGQIRDSLFYVNNELSKYKTLTQAMVRRDEVTSQLKHKIGDLVHLKNDSARVVIEDVLIGGGKYNYYVKYRVLLKDNTSREIVPELIY